MVSTKETKERDRGTMKASEVYHGHAICVCKNWFGEAANNLQRKSNLRVHQKIWYSIQNGREIR